MKPNAAHRGFTLLEIVLAITLSVGLMGSALLFYERAVAIRRAICHKTETLCAIRTVMGRITDELRNSSVFSYLDEGMEGDSESIQFITTQLPGPSAWAIQDITAQPVTPQQDLRRVGYSILQTELDTGLIAVEGLEQTSQTLLTAIEPTEGRQISTELITPHIRFLNLRYFARGRWVDQWSGGNLPLAVQITLGTEPLPAETDPADYPHETYQRIVHIPRAATPRGETIIRGLDGRRPR